jgi:hypothetical protein
MRKMLFVILLTAAVSACGGAKSAIQVSLLEVCSENNQDKDVTTSGYLDDGKNGLLCSNPGAKRMSCGYSVLTNPGGPKVFSAFIDNGSGANQGEKPAAGYKKEDIKVHDDKGSVISLSDKVKLTGKMMVLADRRGCTMTVDKIERDQ